MYSYYIYFVVNRIVYYFYKLFNLFLMIYNSYDGIVIEHLKS